MRKVNDLELRKKILSIFISSTTFLVLVGFLLLAAPVASNAQVKSAENKKPTQDLFSEKKFPGKKVRPVIRAKTSLREMQLFEDKYELPNMDNVLKSKQGRPKNPPIVENPAPPASIFKDNPGMFFDYQATRKKMSLAPSVASPSPTLNFQALGDGLTSIPPDTHGAAGPSHLMTALNTQVRIQDKTGTTTSTVSINSFFSSVNGGGGTFDPRVLYDQMAGRWIVAAVDDAQAASSQVLICVSQTTDPTGAWNCYGYDHDGTDVDWADYPMVGYNKDWIAIGINDFTVAGNAFGGAQSYIFDKSTLYSGAVTPTVLQHDLGTSFGNGHQPAEVFDATESTMYILQTWNSGAGVLRMYTITGTAAAPVFTATGFFPATTGWSFTEVPAAQSGSAVTITTNDVRMQSAVQRNGKLWATQTIFLTGPPARSSIQWWEIDPAATTVTQVGRIDDATAANRYAFPSIAVNAADQALIGYSTFNSASFASAGYAFRSVTDAATVTHDPLTYKTGLGCYNKTFGGPTNRWGDYSHMSIDPTDDTTFWALQEYAETQAAGAVCAANTGRWGTWWAKLIPPCTSIVATGNWNATGTWGCGAIPSAADDAVIVTGQTITLNVDPVAASITVNSGGTLAISGSRTSPTDIRVNGTVDLSGGMLDMGANTLKIGCGGAITGASATNHVLGKIEKEYCATGSFTYPVGENGYSPMTANVTALTSNPTTLTVDVIDSTLPMLPTVNSVSRHWDLTGSGLTADLSFTYLDADVNGFEQIFHVFRQIPPNPPTDQCGGAPCVNTATNTATATGQSSFSNWGVGSLAPTAASTSVSGRVLTSSGRGVPRAVVTAVNINGGPVLTATANQFGYYRFAEVPVAQTYTFSVTSKGFTFTPQVLSIFDEVENLDITASP